jgi:uncharacterized OB-fold protein
VRKGKDELSRQPSVPPGVSLREDDIQARKVLSVMYHPKARYSWATGIAIGRFLRELKAGRIVGTRCGNCGRVVVPPRIFCEWCFRKMEEWMYLPDTGTVNTFSVSYISTDTTRLKTPIIPAVIEIDEASHAGFLHVIGETKSEAVRIGMRVKAIWVEESKRKGSIMDIKYFKGVE